MKNLKTIASMCAAVLLSSGFTPTTPAIAQGHRPATAVRVTNGVSDPLPVNVLSLPAVQVSNLPARETPPEPITLSGVLIVEGGETIANADLSGVPAGKMLVLESFNYETSTPDHTQRHLLTVETFHNGFPRFQRFVPGGRFDNAIGFEIGHHDMKVFADEGTVVRIRVVRSKATAPSTIQVTMTGYLVAAS